MIPWTPTIAQAEAYRSEIAAPSIERPTRCPDCTVLLPGHMPWCGGVTLERKALERPITHRTFVDVQNQLAEKLETAGQIADRQRDAVEKLQLQLEAATRELVRLEGIEAAVIREIDYAREAQTEFEAMELDRHHAEAGESLKAANDQLAQLTEERALLECDD